MFGVSGFARMSRIKIDFGVENERVVMAGVRRWYGRVVCAEARLRNELLVAVRVAYIVVEFVMIK